MTCPMCNSGIFFVYDLGGYELYRSHSPESNVQALCKLVRKFGLFDDKRIVLLKYHYVDKSRGIDTFIKQGYYEVSRENIEFLGRRLDD